MDISHRDLPAPACLPTAGSGSGKEDPHTRPRFRGSGEGCVTACLVASHRGRPHAVSRKASRRSARVEEVQMRKPFQKLFFLFGVLLVASPMIARADEVTDDQDTPAMWRMHS